MAGRVAVFIDGAYLEYVLREEFAMPKIDFATLSNCMAGSTEILRTYYYHCLPWQGNPPTADESLRYSTRRSFFTALERLPRYRVRYGKLAYRGDDTKGNPIYEQKRVDILLSVDLVQLSSKSQIQEAILVAGDSDFIPAVTAAPAEGVLVRLFHGGRPHADLWELSDERVRIDQALIDRALFLP